MSNSIVTRERVARITMGLLRFLGGVISFVLCTVLVGLMGIGDSGLSYVRMTELHSVIHGTAPSTEWVTLIVLLAVGFAIAPVRSEDWTWFVSFRPVFAVWLSFIWCLGTHFGSSLEFIDPSRSCVYPTCWPVPVQNILAGLPILLACGIIFFTDIFRRPINPYMRAVVPSIVFVVSSIIQVLVWDSYVAPWLAGPPPY